MPPPPSSLLSSSLLTIQERFPVGLQYHDKPWRGPLRLGRLLLIALIYLILLWTNRLFQAEITKLPSPPQPVSGWSPTENGSGLMRLDANMERQAWRATYLHSTSSLAV
ncbi:hypothetical protein BO78DRAFT_396565 [Aspergillus sclerotiicarbonarius CBS 121057]|uniref:Uncharacterized protein n=1 Tax=Aspergillus sclerotiicarbonarius (strain CBS 121057 / IBT 28362) TaxID=1448318 RepID=A0A319EY76_ASPSB|nr:hypothetical protein BO78DRAFT_396565 [Aspergillus sclerotiicarbonarius CBS 121057]